MAETKQQLIDKAKGLGLKVDSTLKMADLRILIAETTKKKPKETKKEVKPKEAGEIAKAGKRSAKAVREAEEQEAKKTEKDEPVKKVTKTQKPPRTRLERQSKRFRKNAAKIEPKKTYNLKEAIDLIKDTSDVKFDASVELHINLSVDPRQADQNIRDNVLLPAGSGKKLKIAALTDNPEEALAAGADKAGGDDLIQSIEKGVLDFDILIATPSFMPKLGKYAKILGPKGLMPNPKSGTVTTNVKKAVSEAKAGRVEYRVDPSGIVHLSVGKVSFEAKALEDNVMAIVASVKANKPSSVKSNYIKSAYITTTMGPSVSFDINAVS
jgi:large subunit ribosomal protein L1